MEMSLQLKEEDFNELRREADWQEAAQQESGVKKDESGLEAAWRRLATLKREEMSPSLLCLKSRTTDFYRKNDNTNEQPHDKNDKMNTNGRKRRWRSECTWGFKKVLLWNFNRSFLVFTVGFPQTWAVFPLIAFRKCQDMHVFWTLMTATRKSSWWWSLTDPPQAQDLF